MKIHTALVASRTGSLREEPRVRSRALRLPVQIVRRAVAVIRIPGGAATRFGVGTTIATAAAAMLGLPAGLWAALLVFGLLLSGDSAIGRPEEHATRPSEPEHATGARRAGSRSLALRVRSEARQAWELRDRIGTDPLAGTALSMGYDAEIESWTERVVALLTGTGEETAAHEFIAPPNSQAFLSSLLGIHGTQRERLQRLLKTRAGRLEQIADRLIERESAESLTKHLEEGIDLRARLDTEASPDAKSLPGEDPVYWWALASWEVLREHDPMEAAEFFGSKTPRQRGYFMTAYAMEYDEAGRRAYLDSRIAILNRTIRHR